MKVKICGLRRKDDVSYVNDALPDYAGFILSKGFRRTIDAGLAAKLRALLDTRIVPVGVFVDEDEENAIRMIDDIGLSVIQLHGHESYDYARRMRAHAKVIKVFTPENLDLNFPADYLMIDPGKGNGKAPVWSTIPVIPGDWFLAGGINISNVGEAAALFPYCLDVSSGVETDGVKDRDKIMKIVERIKNI